MFALLARLTACPHPVAVLEGLLLDVPECLAEALLTAPSTSLGSVLDGEEAAATLHGGVSSLHNGSGARSSRGYVYVIQMEGNSWLKIGHTAYGVSGSVERVLQAFKSAALSLCVS